MIAAGRPVVIITGVVYLSTAPTAEEDPACNSGFL
jgi:hypothetical protein